MSSISWRSWLYQLYDNLTRNDSSTPADLMFVLAGRMERKPYGLSLYRAGIASRLLLSVGRFEVSKMCAFGFAGESLKALRDRTVPAERHFFWEISGSGDHIEKRRLRRCSTYGEGLALREFLQSHPARSVVVVSTDIHLRRAAITFDRIFRDAPIELHYCAVPAASSSLKRAEWWTRPEDRRYVFMEVMKLAAYRTILSLPDKLVRRLMRLRDWPQH